MPQKTDAQARRTRQWLLDALIALMQEKPFDQITVTELAGRAELDRRTFYRHYSAKEEIITAHIEALVREYETALRVAPAMNTRAIALAFFHICHENRALLMLLYRHGLLAILLGELNRFFPIIHAKFHAGPDIYEPFDTAYALSYHVGGFWNVLVRWLSDGMARSPEELADMIGHMLPSVI